MTILYFVVVLGVLVLVHEWGHYLMARRAGIRVEAFSIGFGPRLFGCTRGETDFKICLLPLGGFVKMVGEDPEDERAHDPGAFTATSVRARLGVVCAGPVMNLLLAAMLLPVVFWIGRSEPEYLSQPPVIAQIRNRSPAAAAGVRVGERIIAMQIGAPATPGSDAMRTWEEVMDFLLLEPSREEPVTLTLSRDGRTRAVRLTMPEDAPRIGWMGVEPPLFIGNEPVIDAVIANGAAAQAGIRAGDRVLAADDISIGDWQDMADAVHAAGAKPIRITVQRGSDRLALVVTPEWNAELKRFVIGVQKDPARETVPTIVRRYGPVAGLVRGEQELWRLGALTVKFLGRLFTEPRAHYRSLGGPVQIARASMSAAKQGIAALLYFAAFLSLQLGMLNLLPIPVLDGGHVIFLGIEAIRRRPLSLRARVAATQVGMVFLLGMLAIVTYNDLDNLFGFGQWVARATQWITR